VSAQRCTIRPIVVVALFALGCGGLEKLDWTDWGRESWQRPDDLVEALALQPGDRVADIGAGHGYFLSRLARAVGPDGRVYAVDVDAELIRQLEVDAAEENVEVILGTFEDPQIPYGAIDLVLIVNTYNHIE
jgi:ubiquinone/menaquinone biosynthesis C-methylase UbiE